MKGENAKPQNLRRVQTLTGGPEWEIDAFENSSKWRLNKGVIENNAEDEYNREYGDKGYSW